MRRFIVGVGVYILHGCICLAALVVLLALVWVVFYALSVRRARAERLIQGIAALDFANPNEAALRQLEKEMRVAPKCKGDVCSYQSKEDFGFSSSWPFRLLLRSEWDFVGIRPWQLTLEFQTRTGQLSTIDYSFKVGRGRGWLYRESLLSGSMWSWFGVWARGSADTFDSLDKTEEEQLHSELGGQYRHRHPEATLDHTRGR